MLRTHADPGESELDQTDPPLVSGSMLGAYRVIKQLGEARVYAAEHVLLGRRVALEVARSRYAAEPQTVHRFFAEARAVNRVAHEYIVEIAAPMIRARRSTSSWSSSRGQPRSALK